MGQRVHGSRTSIGNYLVGVATKTGDVTCKGKTIGTVWQDPRGRWRSTWRQQLDWHKTRRDAIDAVIEKEATYYGSDYR